MTSPGLFPPEPTIREVQRATAAIFGVPLAAMTERGNTRDITRARHAAMYLARRLTGKSTTVIGRAFERDHTTVLNGVERARDIFRHDPAFRMLIAAARRAIARTPPPT